MPHSQMPMRMPQPRLMQQTHAHLLMGMQGQATGVMVPVAAPLVATPVVQMAEEMRAPVTMTISQQGASGAELSTEAVEFTGSSGDAAAGTGAATTLLPNLANTKEKTPMCLINELARFNKVRSASIFISRFINEMELLPQITHQYRLTSETGPAHKKQFTVTLLLGTEEYTSEGASIKKAQHAAAADALVKTCFEHPPPKTQRVLKVIDYGI
jgi:double-stranded RNA-binding protein Staufen